jgi:hypothetical protein
MIKVVITILEQNMTELNGAESREARTMTITKVVLKLMKKRYSYSLQPLNMTALAREKINCK